MPEEQKQRLREYWHANNVAQRLKASQRKAAIEQRTLRALEAYETLVDRE